jgi:polyphenol oxidase
VAIEWGATDWIAPDWPAPTRVRALVTTRQGGVSRGPYTSLNMASHVGDDPQAVKENRARLRARLPADPLWLEQVHGTEVVCAEESTSGARADAAWSTRTNSVCAVMIADCLPILLCDEQGSIVAAAHAGWRGLSAGIIERTVSAMSRPPESLLAWLGPAIGPSRFEVGAEVRSAFLQVDAMAASAFRETPSGKWTANLYMLGRQRLNALGVNKISGGEFCTFNDAERFFSHRRDRVSGRMAAAIWLASSA